MQGDLAELELRQLTDCDVIFHLAGEPGVRGSWGERFDVYTERNVTATQRPGNSSSSPSAPVYGVSLSSE